MKKGLAVLYRIIVPVYFEKHDKKKHVNINRERSATKQCSFVNFSAFNVKVIPLFALVCKPGPLNLVYDAGKFRKKKKIVCK